MKSHRCIAACAMIGLLVAAPPSTAQDAEPEPPDFFADVPVVEQQGATPEMKKKAIEQAKKAQEKNLSTRLGLRIAELKKVCKLSDTQVRRLELAAKGAVKNELKGFEEKIAKMQQQMMNGFVMVEDADAEEGVVAQAANAALEAIGFKKKETPSGDEPEKEDKEVQQFRKEMGMMYGPMDMMMSGGGATAIEKQKLWQVQLRKTLSDEQWATHRRLVQSRKAYKRKAAVMSVVAGFDAKLLMAEEQREQMTKLVDTQIGKFLEAVPEGQEAYIMESLEDFSSTRRAYGRVRKAAKEFLTDEQYSVFKQRSQDRWEQFGMLWGMMDGGGLAMAVPAEAAIEGPGNDAGFLGVQLIEGEDGVQLQSVTEGQAAKKAGLKVGDVIVSIDGTEIAELSELIEVLRETKPKQKVKLSIVRDEKIMEIEVTLGSRNAEPQE